MTTNKQPTYEQLFAVSARAIGTAAQQQLRNARVVVVGVSGVGMPAIQVLAAAGVGTIVAVDPQRFHGTNFNRAGFAGIQDIGKPKVDLVRTALAGRPHLRVEAVQATAEEAVEQGFYRGATLVLSASNTAESRVTAMREAIRDNCLHVGAGVADARDCRRGAITFWSPNRPDFACHACFLRAAPKRSRRDVLDGTMTAAIGTLAGAVDEIGRLQLTLQAVGEALRPRPCERPKYLGKARLSSRVRGCPEVEGDERSRVLVVLHELSVAFLTRGDGHEVVRIRLLQHQRRRNVIYGLRVLAAAVRAHSCQAHSPTLTAVDRQTVHGNRACTSSGKYAEAYTSTKSTTADPRWTPTAPTTC